MKRKDVIEDNEISELCTYTLGGYEQKVLIEGKRKDSPIVITLHGGPGTPIPFSLDVEDYFQCLRTILSWFIGINLVVQLITV